MLDQQTMLVMTIAGHLIIALAMMIYWRTQKTYPGFGYWALSNVLAAATFILIAVRPVIPVFLAIVIGNSLAVLGLKVRFEGVRAFNGQPAKFGIRLIILFVLLFLSLTYFTYVESNPLARLIIVAILLTYYAVRIAWQLIKDYQDPNRFTAWTIAIAHIFYCCFLNARTVAWIVEPSLRSILVPSAVNIAYLFAELLLDILVAISFITINSQRMAKELSESQMLLENLATTDPLTGISNRRKLHELGQNEILRSRRLNRHFSVIIFDLDHFKEINDRYGHPAGDKLLIEIATRVRAQIREIDFFGRLGGDEFILLLPETSLEECYGVAERIRESIDGHVFEWKEKQIGISTSIGIGELTGEDASIEALIQRVDNNLYRAKQTGRNKISGMF